MQTSKAVQRPMRHGWRQRERLVGGKDVVEDGRQLAGVSAGETTAPHVPLLVHEAP
eukprot:CAMPEP_0196786252 /NCGR_PEP_ID=MMETSP1104-20130614/20975_1 /TAXON_ID=33652 /ORGANISM="Cafeteria sp., Strain Caron Lab Isolate" /LENGTH=55 /DNA_ID=CAMNT_0042156567 /DNA_START=78 /DNA_END=241 /DNA_ORIENTATION=-